MYNKQRSEIQKNSPAAKAYHESMKGISKEHWKAKFKGTFQEINLNGIQVPYIHQLQQPFYDAEMEETIKKRNRMNLLYDFISFTKWNGTEADKPQTRKWEEELIELERIFYPYDNDLNI